MDKIILFHKLCDDGVELKSLLKGVVIPTYNEMILITGGKPKNKDIVLIILSDEESSDGSEDF